MVVLDLFLGDGCFGFRNLLLKFKVNSVQLNYQHNQINNFQPFERNAFSDTGMWYIQPWLQLAIYFIPRKTIPFTIGICINAFQNKYNFEQQKTKAQRNIFNIWELLQNIQVLVPKPKWWEQTCYLQLQVIYDTYLATTKNSSVNMLQIYQFVQQIRKP